MDYSLNAPLFICFLRSYLARQAPARLRALLRGEPCADYRHVTRLLLNSLQVLLALEAQREQALLANPMPALAPILVQQAAVISYCLTLMDTEVPAELPYGLSPESFAHCGELAPVRVVRRVRAANNRLLAANEKYIAAGALPASS